MKAKKIITGLLILAALLLIVGKADLIAGMFGPLGDVIVATAVAVLAAVFILFILLPLLGVIFVGMTLAILFILLALAISLPFAVIKGNKAETGLTEASEMRSMEPFDRMDVAGDLKLLVVSGGGHAVALKGDRHDVKAVRTAVKDGRLMIRADDQSRDDNLRVAVSARDLKTFHIEGVGQASLQGIESETFDLDMSGTAQVDAVGNCHKAVIHMSGAGLLNARDLECDEVDIIVDGAGTAIIFALSHLTVKISGQGQVTYAGNPENIERSISAQGNLIPE